MYEPGEPVISLNSMYNILCYAVSFLNKYFKKYIPLPTTVHYAVNTTHHLCYRSIASESVRTERR